MSRHRRYEQHFRDSGSVVVSARLSEKQVSAIRLFGGPTRVLRLVSDLIISGDSVDLCNRLGANEKGGLS